MHLPEREPGIPDSSPDSIHGRPGLLKYETLFFGPVQKKIKRSKNKSTVQKKARAVSEAGERAVRDGLFGATGPESVLSVVEASRPKNGATKPLILIGFIRFSDLAETHARFSEKRNAFLILLRVFFRKGPQKYQ